MSKRDITNGVFQRLLRFLKKIVQNKHPNMKEITVQELKEKLDQKAENFLLIDVRESFEYMVSNNGGEHIPLSSLQSRVHTLDANQEIAIICRSGARSANACAFLQHEGFENVYNVKGGMKTWAAEIDPSITVA
jgi:rhodanese-related sulfurtransferase